MKKEAIGFIKSQLELLDKKLNNIVIDSDTHITDTKKLPPYIKSKVAKSSIYFHGKPISSEDLIRDMDQNGIDMALTWQNPSCTEYKDDRPTNFKALMGANNYIYESSRRNPDRFLPAGWVDPKALGVDYCLMAIERMVLEYGFPIIKMNPAQNGFFLDSDEVFELVDLITSLEAIPAFHVGSDTEFTPVSALEKLAKRYGDHPILAVHMGGGGAGYLEAEENYHLIRDLGLRYPNLKFPLSAKRDAHIAEDILTFEEKGAPFNENLYFASDAPYGKISWHIGGFKYLLREMKIKTLFTDDDPFAGLEPLHNDFKKRILGTNFCKLIISRYQKMLEKYSSGDSVF